MRTKIPHRNHELFLSIIWLTFLPHSFPLVKIPGHCHLASMKPQFSFLFAIALLALALPIDAQQPTATGDSTNEPQDTAQRNRFWQAALPGGHYMVALERISSVSRHQYVLDGAVIVDEVTVDAVGQALARFYYIEPITKQTGGAAGEVAGRLVDRGAELLDGAARNAGTNIHEMVVKKFPQTTHARTIEYRLMSKQELGALHNSVRTAWETGRGRKIVIK